MTPDITQSDSEFSTATTAGKSQLHVLTLTPFFPSVGDEVSGCFIAESNRQMQHFAVALSVIAVSPVHYPRKHSNPAAPSHWVRYPQIPGPLGLSSAGRWLYARLLADVPQIHKKAPIDVIHAHAALPCGHAAALLSRRLNIPFVVTVHGLDVFNSCFQSGAPADWRRRTSIDVYRAASAVICISKKVQLLLRGGINQTFRTVVIYNGTDPNLFSPAAAGGLSQQKKEILMVGNLLVGKGHELVLRAMGQLRTAFPELTCRIIGEGPDRSRFELLAAELGIQQRVHFETRKSRAEVAAAMKECSIFALPCRYEGLGCVYLEAMATGKPVIACRGQGIEEIIEHEKNGWLIPNWSQPPDAIDELVQGLSTLLGSPDLCSRLGVSARDTILNGLTLSHQAERLSRVYNQVAAQSRTRRQ